MRRRDMITVAALAALLVTGLGPAPAGAQQEFGGTGGNAFEAVCGAKEAMVGIAGRNGAMLDAVEVLCARIGLDGKYVSPPRKTARYGGGGGGDFTLACPTDHVVTAIVGRAGTLIDALGVKCSKINMNYTFGAWSPGSAGPTLGPAGGGGGSQFTSDCGLNPPAVGLSGRAGTLVDRIRLRCSHYNNIGLGVDYQRYTVSVNVTPSGNVWEGNSVTVTWSVAGGGPPSSIPGTPKFKVEVVEPQPPPAGGTPSWSPPSWPSAGDIMAATMAAYDYSGFSADTSKTIQLTKPGNWGVRVTAIPFRPEGGGMRMFGGSQTVTVKANVKPPTVKGPASAPMVPAGKMMERKVR